MTPTSLCNIGAAPAWRLVSVFALGLFLTVSGLAAGNAKKTFDVPADTAAHALKQFAQQSGEQLLYAPEDLAGVKTLAVKGEFTAREALEKLLADTPLVVAQDKSTGALAIRRDAGPNALRVAQDEATTPVNPDKIEGGKQVLETVEVTGHKVDGLINKGILQAGPNAPVYHNVVSRADIERLGVSSVQELFRLIPQTSTGATSLQNAVGSFGIGARFSTVSMRGFSAAQTVILINGRPLPRTGATGIGGADLDRIPLAAIERVEIMPLAGSAIYGSGAVGGAINIILRKDYTGRDLTTYIGTSTDGGATEFRTTYVEGRNFNGGRTNLTLTFSYNRREGLRANQRDYLDEVLARYGPDTTRSSSGVSAFETFTIPAFASTAPIIRVNATSTAAVNDLGVPGAPGLRWVQVPAGTTNAQSVALTPGSFTAVAGQFKPNNRYSRMMLYEPQESLNLNAQVEHKFIPKLLEGYGEFTLGRSSRNYTYPEVVSLSLSATDPLNPFRTNVTPGFVGRAVTVYFDSPDIPDGHFWMRSDSARAVMGLKGELTPKWSWSADAAIDYSQSETTVRNSSGSSALTSVLSLTQFSSGAADVATRRSLYNLLADHNQFPIDATVAEKYFGFARRTINRSVQQEYNMRLTGDVFELPAGPLRTSLAGKFRIFELDTSYTQGGTNDFYLLTTGAPAPASGSNPTTAKRNTWQGAVELVAPLISERWRPLPVESLDLNLSASTESFNAAGLNQSSQLNFDLGSKRGETYVAAAKLQLTRDVALRVSYSQGIYPPDWSDLSDAITTFSSSSVLPDPKRGMTVSSTPFIVANGGNPDLQPEKATSQNLGLLFTPRFLKGFSLTVDVWRTKKEDAIVRTSSSSILSNLDDYAAYVTRADPTPAEAALGWAGIITGLRTGPINIAQLQTNGVDVQTRYEFPSPIAGKIIMLGNASFTDHFQTRALPSSSLIETAGAGGPLRRRGYGSATWEGARVSVTVTGRYVDHYSSSTTAASPAYPYATGYDGGRIPAFLHWDLQTSYSFPFTSNSRWVSGLKITVGVLNALNEKSSFVSDGAAFYNREDDPRQRFVYMSFKKSF